MVRILSIHPFFFFLVLAIHGHSFEFFSLSIAAEGAENGLEFTIVRPFNWIGPRMDFIPGIDGPSEGVPRVLACFSNVCSSLEVDIYIATIVFVVLAVIMFFLLLPTSESPSPAATQACRRWPISEDFYLHKGCY